MKNWIEYLTKHGLWPVTRECGNIPWNVCSVIFSKPGCSGPAFTYLLISLRLQGELQSLLLANLPTRIQVQGNENQEHDFGRVFSS